MNLEEANSINFKEKYLVKTDFPEITLTNLPQDILMKIKRAFTGIKSEFTSLTQYSYQHIVLSNDEKVNNISRALEEIAAKEMMHYEVLGKVLAVCGVEPKNCVYIDGNKNLCDYWKASNVDYTTNIVKMFESNLAAEKRAIEEYNEILAATTNDNLKDIIRRIIQDEVSHVEYFSTVLEALKN